MTTKKPDMSIINVRRKSGSGNPELAKIVATGELTEVLLSLVDRDDGQPRTLVEVMDGIEEFANELERDDFVLAQHPVFHIEDDGRYTIVVGERRTTAFRLKGRETITAVCKKFTEAERKKLFILQYVENDGKLKKALSPLSDAKWWRTFADRYHGGNVAAAAKERGRTESEVSNRLAILDAPSEIVDFAQSSGLKDPATIAGLVRIAKRAGTDAAVQIINEFKAGEIKGSFRNHVAAMAKLLNKEADVTLKSIPKPTLTKTTPQDKTAAAGSVEGSKKPENTGSVTKEKTVKATSPGESTLIQAITLLDKARLSNDLIDRGSDGVEDSFKSIIKALDEAQDAIKDASQQYKAELMLIKQVKKNANN